MLEIMNDDYSRRESFDYEVFEAIMKWYKDYASVVYLDKIWNAWDVYNDDDELALVFVFIDGESREEMIDIIGGFEYEIIELDDGRILIGNPELLSESYS